jgi:hypothetical protein
MPSVGTARVVGSIAARARGIQERQRAGGAIQVVVAAVQTFWNHAPQLEAIMISSVLMSTGRRFLEK